MIVNVACGKYHRSAVTSAGSVYTWARDRCGTSNNVLPTPLQDFRSKVVISVSADQRLTAPCVTKDGEVFTWGRGSDSKLGHGDESDEDTPKRVEALVGVKAKEVSCGEYHSAVCAEDGRVYTFGWGEYGCLGHGDKTNMTSPSLVKALEGKHFTQVQCGDGHTVANVFRYHALSKSCVTKMSFRLQVLIVIVEWLSIPSLVLTFVNHNKPLSTTTRNNPKSSSWWKSSLSMPMSKFSRRK